MFALDEDVYLVRVPMEGTAALVTRKVMRAVDVLGDPELHQLRPKVRAAIKLGLRALDRRDSEELQRFFPPLKKLVFLVRLNEQHDPRSQCEFFPADDGNAAPFRDDELVIPLAAVRRRETAFRNDQPMPRRPSGPGLMPDERPHPPGVTAFLQKSPRGDRPEGGP